MQRIKPTGWFHFISMLWASIMTFQLVQYNTGFFLPSNPKCMGNPQVSSCTFSPPKTCWQKCKKKQQDTGGCKYDCVPWEGLGRGYGSQQVQPPAPAQAETESGLNSGSLRLRPARSLRERFRVREGGERERTVSHSNVFQSCSLCRGKSHSITFYHFITEGR